MNLAQAQDLFKAEFGAAALRQVLLAGSPSAEDLIADVNAARAAKQPPAVKEPTFSLASNSNNLVTVSFGSTAKSARIISAKQRSFEDLATWLSTAKQRGKLHHGKLTAAEYAASDKATRAAEKDGEWYSLAQFNNGRRSVENFVRADAIGFDIEGKDYDAEGLRSALNGYEYVAVSSYGHMINGEPRWRVVMRLLQPITSAAHFAAVHAHITEAIGAPSAAAAKDAARLWFVPGCPSDMVDKHETFYHRGVAFDPSEILVPEAKVAPAEAVEPHADEAKRVEYAKRVLERYKLPADRPCRDEWVKAGMAVHHHTGGSDVGFIVWQEWSESQPGYASEADCRGRWDSFGKRSDSPVTISSLERAAIDSETRALTPDAFDVVKQQTASAPEKAAGERVPVKRRTLIAGEVKLPSILGASYLVKRWIPSNALVMLHGKWNAGKTFISLSLGAHVAAGKPWFDNLVKQTGVLVFGYEGDHALARRLYALRQEHAGWNWQDLPFEVELMSGPLVGPKGIWNGSGRAQFDAALHDFQGRRGAFPGLVIVDPLRNALGGSDSDSTLTEAYLTLARQVRMETRATVLTVHHPGHTNADRSRGDSGLEAAMDAVLRVDAEQWTIGSTKQRDDAKAAMGYKLKVLELGRDADGDPVTTCVALPGERAFGTMPPMQAKLYKAALTVCDPDGTFTRANAVKASGLEKQQADDAWKKLKGRDPRVIEPAGDRWKLCERGAARFFDAD